ncbi:MAG: alanyl-tRNA editing protein [Candidatus Heimdallarchaeaceae archaeon]
MTELLFRDDAYIKEFTAKVKAVEEDYIILDRTAFSYRGGGLKSDTGKIITADNVEYEVKEVISKKGRILHQLSPMPDEKLVGQEIRGIIDWERRYRQMRMHTCLHAISGVLFKKYGAHVTGGDIKPEKSRVDFEIDHLREERVEEIKETITKIIEEDHVIKVSYMKRSEALQNPDLIRTKVNLIPESVKTIRIVEIEGVDIQADGGVHVASTKEIGEFVPLKAENRGKNNKRLYFTVKP